MDRGARARASALLAAHRDLLDSRPDVAVGGGWEEGRGQAPPLPPRDWSGYLLGLDDVTLGLREGQGAAADWGDAPSSLRAFVDDVRAVCVLPVLGTRDDGAARRHETPTKQTQIDAVAGLVAGVVGSVGAGGGRVVDVGSGHGHLTRALAKALQRRVVGLERDVALAARARALAVADGVDVDFEVADVVSGEFVVAVGDVVVGLHACGELGDVAARAVGAAEGNVGLVFVGCCLQKQRALARRPLSVDDERLSLPKELLGLSNLTPRDDGKEAARADNLTGRTRRIALRLLLSSAGVDVRPRAELEGLNRRAAHEPLPALVARAFALRGLAVPGAAAIDAAFAAATTLHGQFRRLALPRTMLARVVEIFVCCDRAASLADRGFDVDVGVAFSADVSPRNLAIVARRG